MEDQQFRQLLNKFGLSWDGYRKVRRGIKKRIGRHMQAIGCRTLQEYIIALDQHKDAKQHFERLITVSISRFFRDQALWQAIENQILPTIIKENRKRVRVWSAGCACGEEVYTFKILWHALSRRFQCLPKLEILATDMNPVYLDKARAGRYPFSSLREIPEGLRTLCFRSNTTKTGYTIAEHLKKGIKWRCHNLLFDPSFTNFDVVFLRNSLLTYYEDELKVPAFKKLLEGLVLSGLLLIGSHEKIPSGVQGLLPFGHHPCIFQKKD